MLIERHSSPAAGFGFTRVVSCVAPGDRFDGDSDQTFDEGMRILPHQRANARQPHRNSQRLPVITAPLRFDRLPRNDARHIPITRQLRKLRFKKIQDFFLGN